MTDGEGLVFVTCLCGCGAEVAEHNPFCFGSWMRLPRRLQGQVTWWWIFRHTHPVKYETAVTEVRAWFHNNRPEVGK